MKPLQKLDTTAPDSIVSHRDKKRAPDAHPNDGFRVHVANAANYLLAKRSFDILFACLGILFLLSWLLPLAGLLIKLDSRGPVLFRQKRVGKNGRPFTCLKLRTMILNMEADETPAQENDYRITRLGAWLRRSHLDELPQLFNVLSGSMSIVGPRPHMVADCIRFSFVIPSYSSRHRVKPGITGWAQVNGYHGPTADYESIISRYYWDTQYIRRAGLWLDIRIVSATVGKGLKQAFRFLIQPVRLRK